jgi:hypothetical protein
MYDCAGRLFAITGPNPPGETFLLPNSLLLVNGTSGAATTLCTFGGVPTGPPVRVGAFINTTHLAVFFTDPAGGAQMLLLPIASLSSGPCRGV